MEKLCKISSRKRKMYLCVFSVRDPDAFALILCEYYLSMIISGKRTHKIRRLDPDLRKSRY